MKLILFDSIKLKFMLNYNYHSFLGGIFVDVGYLWLIGLLVLLVAIVFLRAKAWNDFFHSSNKDRKK